MEKPTSRDVLAVIPVRERDIIARGRSVTLAGRPVLGHTVEVAKAAAGIGRVLVSTDGPDAAELACELGAEAPFVRPAELAGTDVPLVRVVQHCLNWLSAAEGYSPSVVVLLEVSHPLRPAGLLDRVLETLYSQNLETVFTAFESHHVYWTIGQDGKLARVDSEEKSTRYTRRPFYGQMSGLVCATRSTTIHRGAIIGLNVGIVPVRGLLGLVDLQEEGGFELAEFLVSKGHF